MFFQPFEDGINSRLNKSSEKKWSFSNLPCVLQCLSPLAVLLFIGTSLFTLVYTVSEPVFGIIGLVKASNLRSDDDLRTTCLEDATTWLIVYGSFAVAILFFSCCCGCSVSVSLGDKNSFIGFQVFYGLLQLFLLCWVFYGMWLKDDRGDLYKLCDSGYYKFFRLTVNYMFYGWVAWFGATIILAIFYVCGLDRPDASKAPKAAGGADAKDAKDAKDAAPPTDAQATGDALQTV